MIKDKGMVLLLTFIIITTLTAIVVAFLYLTSTQLKGAGYDTASHKVLWIAEGGIQKAIWYLQRGGLNGSGGTTTTDGMTESLGNGSYKIVVTQHPTVAANRIIASTGTVGDIQRKITLTVQVRNPYQTGYGVAEQKDWNETAP